MFKWPKKQPEYYVNWDEVKTFDELKSLIMLMTAAQGRVSPRAAEVIRKINPKIVQEVSD